MRQEKIYDLNLHESIDVKDFIITRVPGGWIYLSRHDYKASVFVPLSYEFYNWNEGKKKRGGSNKPEWPEDENFIPSGP